MLPVRAGGFTEVSGFLVFFGGGGFVKISMTTVLMVF